MRTTKSLRQLIPIWKKDLPLFLIGTFGVGVRNFGIVFLNTLYSKEIIENVSVTSQISPHKDWLFTITIIVLFCLLDAVFLYIQNTQTHAMVNSLSQDAYEKVLQADYYQLGRLGDKGEIISRLASDSSLVQSLLRYQILTPILTLFSGVGATFSLLFVKKGWLLAAGAYGVSLVLFLVQFQISKKMHHRQVQLQEGTAEATTKALFSFERKQEIWQAGLEDKAIELIDTANQSCIRIEKQLNKLNVVNGTISRIPSIIQYGIGPLIGILMFQFEHIQVGSVVLIGPLMAMIVSMVTSIGDMIVSVRKAGAGLRRVMDFVNLPQETVHGQVKSLSFDPPLLEIKDLKFAYPGGESVFNQFSARVDEAIIIGIKGNSGSGKTTLMRILMGLYPYEGSCRILGNEVKDYETDFWRSSLCYIPQHDFFLSGTAEEALKAESSEEEKYSSDQIVELLKEVGLENIRLDKRSTSASTSSLSGGELQRLALAKVLLDTSKVVILDETFSGIDAEAKDRLFSLIKLRKNHQALCLVISHDERILNRCDAVVCIPD